MRELIVVILVGVLLTGCRSVFQPDPEELPVQVPDTWTSTASASQDVNGWLQTFQDLRLDALVDEAVGRNFDLQAAYARLEQAAATHRIDRSGLWPTLDGEFSAGRSRRNTLVNDRPVPSRAYAYDLGLVANWELDVWGRVRSEAQAAGRSYAAVEADLAGARLSLAGQVARTWYNLQAATADLALSLQTLSSFHSSQQIIEERFTDGLTTALDVRLGRASVATARARLEAARRDVDRQSRLLEVLVGRYPAATLAAPGRLPETLAAIPVGLPAELLERRPDLVAARRRYLAATARTAAARKDRLPAFRLTASGGTASDELKNLLNSHYLVWNLAAGVSQPIFNAGELAARVELTEARADEALVSYAQTVLEACREVETALAAETWLLTQETALRDAAIESEEAEQIALEQYNRGLVEITTLLVAQRRVFEARSALIQISNQRLQNRIDLHLALGGEYAPASTQP